MLSLVAGLAWPLAGSAAVADPSLFDETAVRTLFAFDQVSIPFSQNLKIEMRQPKKMPGNPVMTRGAPGTPDSWAVQFYGSILREQGKFRMWYVAKGDDSLEKARPSSASWHVAYAESTDGVHWTKPDLGLVEFRGSRKNNLVFMDPASLGVLNVKVISDPEEPDPARRYKMAAHVFFMNQNVKLGSLATFVSADGLRWTMVTKAEPVEGNLVKADLLLPPVHFEPAGGLYRWEGMYYISGQNAYSGSRPYHGRVARGYFSPDFVRWAPANAINFVRPAQHTLLGPGRSRDGEQTHEGIAVWNRGNVLLGISGRWHGAMEWKGVTIDLGFVLSNDGVSFREPAHEWTFLPRGEDGAWDQGGLLQGQGFENIGDQTYIYYGAWDPRIWEEAPARGGVGIATLPRDRFGDLRVDERNKGSGPYEMPVLASEFITAAIPAKAGLSQQLFLNADGLGAEAGLKIELLGAEGQPLPEFSGKNAAMVRQSGFQTPILWKGQAALIGLPERFRIKVSYEGERKTEIRVSALYVRNG